MTQTTPDTRPLLHELANEFGVLYGTAELFAASPGLSERERRDVAVMLDALRNLAALLASAGPEAEPRRLTAELAHELRTPLQAVLGFAEMLQAGEAWDDCLRGVVTAGRHMADLLDGAIAPGARERTASASAAVAQAVLLAAPQARAANVRVLPTLFNAACDPSARAAAHRAVDDLVRADPLRLRQAVLNLLTNAVHCSPPGGEVSVTVSRRAAGWKSTVRIAVRDRGPGLTAAEITELLSMPRGERPHGLGLLITRDLVDGMDGTLKVASLPARGSCFSIDIPALPELRG